MDQSKIKDINVESLVESCKPVKKRGRPSHKRQLHEIREEGRLNLQTSDSVVVATNLKSILTLESLHSLPIQHQTQLIRLLPKFDRVCDKGDNTIKASATALSNEYFARFCSQFQEKLSDNKFSGEAVEQAKTDTSKELAKLDPWKLKNFEPIWGQKLISQSVEDEDENAVLDRLLQQISAKKLDQKRNSTRQTTGRRRIKRRLD